MNGDSSAACYIFTAPCISHGFLHFFQIHAKRQISQQILEREHSTSRSPSNTSNRLDPVLLI